MPASETRFGGKNYIIAPASAVKAVMKIAVLIVNWNGGALLSRCLQSLSVQRRAPDSVVVVDNASSDGSLDQAAPWLGTATVIRLDENVGFARGNNIAAAAAGESRGGACGPG